MRAAAAAWLLATVAWGCDVSTTQDPGETATRPLSGAPALRVGGLDASGRLPEGFLFGTAVAGFQVDMGCPTIPASRCTDTRSDWYQFVTAPAFVNDSFLYISGEPPTRAPGFYETYPQDLDRSRNELHNNAVRVSIEWSRIFPRSTVGVSGYNALRGIASSDALAFYHGMFSAMRARGLRPLVTVNHYTLPLWIHNGLECKRNLSGCTKRGWLGGSTIVNEIAKYAGFIAREFGGDVDLWATLNEPFTAVVIPAYLAPTSVRSNPPGVQLKVSEAKQATMAMIDAHARMYDAIKANDTVDADGDGLGAAVGLVYAVTAVSPYTTNAQDAAAARDADYFMNRMFLNAVTKGIVDKNWNGRTTYRADLANRMDYLGVNYYVRMGAQAIPIWSPLKLISPYLSFNLFDLHLTSDPSGIAEVLGKMKSYGIPLAITETGVEDKGEDEGARWLTQTFPYVQRAIADGAPVFGYFYWSLMDNYEWNHGTAIRLGLYEVDFDDAARPRTARSAVNVYGRIATERTVAPDLANAYAAPF